VNQSVLLPVGAVALIGAAVTGAVVIWSAGGSSDTDALALRPDDLEIVAHGSQVYAENCASCHGADLAGQPNWRAAGPDGRLPAPPHDASGHTWHHDGDTLFRLTKYGVGQLIGDPDYGSNMPAYDGILTDAEIIAALSYIKSTWSRDIRDQHNAMETQE
jgi:mono/diheme cytochrome c family protein